MLWAGNDMAMLCLLLLSIYGLWALFVGLRRKFCQRQGQGKPFISILVIARNDEARIEGVVRWLLGLDYVNACGDPNFEVVAVSGGSKDQTPAILERLAREQVRLVTKSVAWTQAYEEGLTLCQGEVVCLLDLAKQPAHKAGQAMERMLNE